MLNDGVSAFILQHNLCSGRLVADTYSNNTLLGITEGLRHTGSTCTDKSAARNNSALIIVECCRITLCRTYDYSITTGNLKCSVGIQTVAGGVDIEVAAGNYDRAVSEDIPPKPPPIHLCHHRTFHHGLR